MPHCLVSKSTDRPLKNPKWPAVALACLSIVVFAPAQAETLKGPDALALLADSTIDFSRGGHSYFEYFAPDGTSRGGNGTGKSESGKWYVRPDDTVCLIHADLNQSGCVFIQAGESSIEFHRVDGLVEGPFGHVRGNPKGL